MPVSVPTGCGSVIVGVAQVLGVVFGELRLKFPPLCPKGLRPVGLSLPQGERRNLDREDFGVLANLNNCVEILRKMIKPNDLVLIQGAGDIHGCVGDLKKIISPSNI